MKNDGAKKSAQPSAFRSLLPPDKAPEMKIKLSHYVTFMWENCAIGEFMRIWLGEKLRRKVTETYHASNWNENCTWRDSANNMLQTCFNPVRENKCRCVRAGLNCSEFCDCQQYDYQSRMHMVDNEIEDENNDRESGTGDEYLIRYDIIIFCINLAWRILLFSLNINLPVPPYPPPNFKYEHIVFCFLFQRFISTVCGGFKSFPSLKFL